MKEPSGNALFLILIAVALFAALSYAVTQSGRGGGDINKEQAIVLASQITGIAAGYHSGVMRLILTGTDVGDLVFCSQAQDNCDINPIGFNPCETGQDCLFSPEGGGITFQYYPNTAISSGATDRARWCFWNLATNNKVDQVGTSAPDVMTLAGELTLGVCEAIDKSLNLSPPILDTIGGVNCSNDNRLLDAYPGEPFACFQTITGLKYWYYHVLSEQ